MNWREMHERFQPDAIRLQSGIREQACKYRRSFDGITIAKLLDYLRLLFGNRRQIDAANIGASEASSSNGSESVAILYFTNRQVSQTVCDVSIHRIFRPFGKISSARCR
jgi:hypothetical protein